MVSIEIRDGTWIHHKGYIETKQTMCEGCVDVGSTIWKFGHYILAKWFSYIISMIVFEI
jgi:hypothetical protein